MGISIVMLDCYYSKYSVVLNVNVYSGWDMKKVFVFMVIMFDDIVRLVFEMFVFK